MRKKPLQTLKRSGVNNMFFVEIFRKSFTELFLHVCFDKSYWDGKMISMGLKWSVFMTTDECEKKRERGRE